jgi:ketosteroid isomerase-like protein
MRHLPALIALLLLPACHQALHEEPASPRRSPEQGREELLQADREFAVAAAEHGLEGWMSVMAPDAVRIDALGGELHVGSSAIQALDAPMFSDPALSLAWSPERAHLFDDGRHGLTTGRFEARHRAADGSERVLATGHYLTLWRLSDDGRWTVILDTGATDPPGSAP